MLLCGEKSPCYRFLVDHKVELLCRLFCFHLTVTEDIFKLGCLHECSEVCVKMGGEADRFADAQNNQLEIQ